METVKVVRIETLTQEEQWVLPVTDAEITDYVDPSSLEKARLEELCGRYGVSSEFVIEVNSVFESFREAVHQDLSAIWKRLDKIEKLD